MVKISEKSAPFQEVLQYFLHFGGKWANKKTQTFMPKDV